MKKNKWSLFAFSEAYYYIDDLSLIVKNPEDDAPKYDTEGGVVNWLPHAFHAGKSFEIKNLFFEKGTSKLMSTSDEALNQLAKMLMEYPTTSIQLNGHMDKSEDEVVQKQLSKERAKAVYDYFKSHGVTNQMIFKGLGSSQPVAPNDSEEYKAKNRRVEVSILKE